MLRIAPTVAVALLTVPIAVGLLAVLLPSFGYLPVIGGTELTFDPWRRLFAQPALAKSIVVSLTSGLFTTAVALAAVCLFIAGSSRTRIYSWFRRLISPLLSVPHAAAAFGFAFLVAPSGLLARTFSPWATGWERPPDILIVHDPWGLTMMVGLVAKEIPFLMLMCFAALPQIEPARRVTLARSLGYAPAAAWFKTVFPGLYPLIRLPVYAVIAYASSTVDVALILGPTNPPTVSVAVIRWLNDPDLSMRFMASAGAVLQLIITVAAIAIWWGLEVVVRILGRRWLENGDRSSLRGISPIWGAGFMALSAAAIFLGLSGLAISSLAGFWRFPEILPAAFTLRAWERSGPAIAETIWTSLLLGGIAAAVSLAVVTGALENEVRRHRRAGHTAMLLLYLPLIVPQTAFLLGMVFSIELAGVRPGFWPVVFSHIVFVLPYVYLSLSEPYRRLDPRWIQVALSLGTSPARAFWRVRLPLLMMPFLAAFAIGLAVSVGLYLPTLLIGAGRVATVTTEAVALSSGGDRRIIGVWALVQAFVPAFGFTIALLVPRFLWRNRRGMREIR